MFSQKSFYISENGNPEKNPYISGYEIFLYFTKRNFLTSQEVTLPARKVKRTQSLKFSYNSGHGAFLYFRR